jgi:hypothetical protein
LQTESCREWSHLHRLRWKLVWYKTMYGWSSKPGTMLKVVNQGPKSLRKGDSQTVPQSIIIVGRTYLKPYRLVRNWTGNSAVRKQRSWMVVPCLLVNDNFFLGQEHTHCCSHRLSDAGPSGDCRLVHLRDLLCPTGVQRTAT